jgi:hypothetical protein
MADGIVTTTTTQVRSSTYHYFRNTYTSTLLLKSTPLATHLSNESQEGLLGGGGKKYECIEEDGIFPQLRLLMDDFLPVDEAAVLLSNATVSLMECVLEPILLLDEYRDGRMILDTD